MILEQGSKKTLVLDIVLIVAIIFCGILAYLSYNDVDEFTISRAYQYPMLVTDNQYLISFNFTSNVFSAQNEIEVSIIAYPENDNPSRALFIYLPDSNIKGVSTYHDGIQYDDPIFVHMDEDGVYRSEGTLITYPQEGMKCFYAFELLVDRTPSGCIDDAPETLHISSVDSLYQFNNNKITLSLAYVFLAFTIIMVRDFIQGVGRNIMRLLSTRKKDTTKTKPK